MYRVFAFEYKRSDCGNFVDVDKESFLKVIKGNTSCNKEKTDDLVKWLEQKHKSGNMWQWFDKLK